MQVKEPVDFMPLYWRKLVTHRIVLKATEDRCDLHELERRSFRVPLHKASQSTSVVQCIPSPYSEYRAASDGRKGDLLYTICTAGNVVKNRHKLYQYVASDVGIINLH